MGRCRGKVRFSDEDEAHEGLVNARRHKERERLPVRFYPCPWCQGYHLTSREDRVGTKERKIINETAFKRYLK